MKLEPYILRGKKFQVLNKDGTLVGEYDNLEDAILECWVILGQKVLDTSTRKVIYP